MRRRLTTKEFVIKAKKIHGNKYNYSKSNYIRSNVKIDIICPIHGSFKQKPHGHLSGAGCKKCGTKNMVNKQRLGIDDFIKKSISIHGDKYDYSKVIYSGWSEKVDIICDQHGIFSQRAGDHLKGEGCKECGIDSRSRKMRMDIEDVIKKCIEVHGDQYNYSQIKYKNNRTKMKIFCNKHKVFFLQSFDSHVTKKCGCPKCGYDSMKKTREEFVKLSNKVHYGKYNYDKSIFIDMSTKIEIVCPDHGVFWQTPDSHSRGKGCRRCLYKNEYILGEKIKQHFYDWKIEEQKVFNSELYYKSSRRFDFFLSKDKMRVAVEYDGKQHYEPVRFGGISMKRAIKKFKRQQKIDCLDKQFCKENGIMLYRVKYNDDKEQSILKLKNILESKQERSQSCIIKI